MFQKHLSALVVHTEESRVSKEELIKDVDLLRLEALRSLCAIPPNRVQPQVIAELCRCIVEIPSESIVYHTIQSHMEQAFCALALFAANQEVGRV